MRKLGILAAAASLAFGATPALALPTITFTTGSGVLNTTIGTANYSQNFNSSTTFSGAPNSAYKPIAGETVGSTTPPGGARLELRTFSNPGLNISPPLNGDGKYLAILDGGTFKIDFATNMRALTFVLGTLDPTNYVKLFYSNGNVETLPGTQLTGGAASYGGQGMVRYDFGTGTSISSVLFGNEGRAPGSPSSAFEIDTIVAAAPEPATWLMMIMGFGLVGGALRRRRAAGKLATA